MSSQLRDTIAEILYPIKAHTLPAVCERYGLDPGEGEEAFSSKTRYIMRRLQKLSDEKVFDIAKKVARDYPNDKLLSAIEAIEKAGLLVTDLTRSHLLEALNGFSLAGKRGLIDLLRKHCPSVESIPSEFVFGFSLVDDIQHHAINKGDLSNAEILQRVGFMTCSQTRLFHFLEDVVHPIRRDQADQQRIVQILDPILRRDGYTLTHSSPVSGYPNYKIVEALASATLPADDLISNVLFAFNESGVHEAWKKALDRRISDPEGAITAAKTLLETVCKHIADAAEIAYGDSDDLPKLYAIAAEHLHLAPSQHSETTFRSILGNCQSIVGNLAGLRNKLGDSHGQGKRYVKPQARHAELAVNLAGSMAMFLVSTWNARQ